MSHIEENSHTDYPIFLSITVSLVSEPRQFPPLPCGSKLLAAMRHGKAETRVAPTPTEIFPFGLALAHPTRREFIAHFLEDASYDDLYQHECIMPTKTAFNKPLYELSHTSSELAGIFVLHLPKRLINSFKQERFFSGWLRKSRFSSAYSSNTSAGLFLHEISVSVSSRFSVRIRFNIDCDILLLINPLCARNHTISDPL